MSHKRTASQKRKAKQEIMRQVRRRQPKEFASVGGVIVAIVVGLLGAALLVLATYLFLSAMTYLFNGGNPFVLVGEARPIPLPMAIIGTVVGILGGIYLMWQTFPYLFRCFTGKLPWLRGEALREHSRKLEERRQRLRAGQLP